MKSTSTIKRTKDQKIKALVGMLAIKIAQQKQDPLYDKYLKYKQQYMELKQKIIKKYLAQAKKLAKKAIKQSEK